MSETNSRKAYDARCASLANVAMSQGLALHKVAGKHELEVSRGTQRVVFPIVTDERDWRETTSEEAFYGVLIDAKSWRNVHVDDATEATLDVQERDEIPLVKQDESAEEARLRQLAEMLGGEAQLDALFALVEIT